MKKIQFARIAWAAIAVVGFETGFATAQGLGGASGRVNGGGNATVNGQAQRQIQGQVRQQVQQQVQAQAQARVQGQISSQAQLQAEAARAGVMAQRAIDDARQKVALTRGVNAEGSLGASFDTNGKSRSQKSNQQNGIANRSDANANASFNRSQANMTQGLSEGDMRVYDTVFGSSNPFRAEVRQTGVAEPNARGGQKMNQRISSVEQSSRGVGTASATADMDLAVRIDSAVQQRRSEISMMRDRALETSDQTMMDRADQMENMLDVFVEARARAAAETRGQMEAEGARGSVRSNEPNPNSDRMNDERNSQIRNSSSTKRGR